MELPSKRGEQASGGRVRDRDLPRSGDGHRHIRHGRGDAGRRRREPRQHERTHRRGIRPRLRWKHERARHRAHRHRGAAPALGIRLPGPEQKPRPAGPPHRREHVAEEGAGMDHVPACEVFAGLSVRLDVYPSGRGRTNVIEPKQHISHLILRVQQTDDWLP